MSTFERPTALSQVLRNMEICLAYTQGRMGILELAEKYQLSERQIYRILRNYEDLAEGKAASSDFQSQ